MESFLTTRETKLFAKVRKLFKHRKSDALHDIDHIARVAYWAAQLLETEPADKAVVMAAAILHDIAMPQYGDRLHARKGAQMCLSILNECGYSEEEAKAVSQAILMHSTDDPNPPATLEARVLFDADKLDATGPASLHRWFFEYEKRGLLNFEAVEKSLSHIKKWKKRYGNPPFFTKTGRKLGAPRLKYVEDCCKEILRDSEKFKNAYLLI